MPKVYIVENGGDDISSYHATKSEAFKHALETAEFLGTPCRISVASVNRITLAIFVAGLNKWNWSSAIETIASVDKGKIEKICET